MAELILALDLPSGREAIRLLERLPDRLRWVKVGAILMTAEGPDLVRELLGKGYDVFLDLKWHDIPTTVREAVTAARELGVRMVPAWRRGRRSETDRDTGGGGAPRSEPSRRGTADRTGRRSVGGARGIPLGARLIPTPPLDRSELRVPPAPRPCVPPIQWSILASSSPTSVGSLFCEGTLERQTDLRALQGGPPARGHPGDLQAEPEAQAAAGLRWRESPAWIFRGRSGSRWR